MVTKEYKNYAFVKTGVRFLIIPVMIIISLLMRCTSSVEPMAGGTSIPNQIAGIIRNTDGTPVKGAGVKLIDIVSTGALLPEVVDSTETDSRGKYQFMNMEEGTYAIEAAYEHSKVLYREDISVGYEDTIDISGDLVVGGTVIGSVSVPDGMNGMVHIAHTHYSAIPDPKTGAFIIKNLEPGRHTVLIIIQDPATGNSAIISRDTVLVKNDSPTDVGVVKTESLHTTSGTLVIDDFEDSNNLTVQGQYWWMFDDRYDGGNSTVVPFDSDSMVQVEADGNVAAHCIFEFGDDARPRHIGMGFTFGDSYRGIPRVFDLSGLRKIRLQARGNGCEISIDIRPELLSSDIGINDLSTRITSDWKEYVVDVASLTASGPSAARNLRYGNRFIIVATGDVHESGELWIDDVVFEY